jgi:hypothetical protein
MSDLTPELVAFIDARIRKGVEAYLPNWRRGTVYAVALDDRPPTATIAFGASTATDESEEEEAEIVPGYLIGDRIPTVGDDVIVKRDPPKGRRIIAANLSDPFRPVQSGEDFSDVALPFDLHFYTPDPALWHFDPRSDDWRPTSMRAVMVKGYRATILAIPHNVVTTLQLGPTAADDDPEFGFWDENNGWVVVPAGYGGLYVVNCHLNFAASAGGTFRWVQIAIDGAGAEVRRFANVAGTMPAGAMVRLDGTKVLWLAEGQTVSLQAAHNAGVGTFLDVSDIELTMARIGVRAAA